MPLHLSQLRELHLYLECTFQSVPNVNFYLRFRLGERGPPQDCETKPQFPYVPEAYYKSMPWITLEIILSGIWNFNLIPILLYWYTRKTQKHKNKEMGDFGSFSKSLLIKYVLLNSIGIPEALPFLNLFVPVLLHHLHFTSLQEAEEKPSPVQIQSFDSLRY